MPTVLRQFPVISRSGTQQTAYATPPDRFTGFHLTGQATSQVLSNTNNAIQFDILASPTGSDQDAILIQREYWHGGTRVNKNTGLSEPNPIDIGWGSDARYVDWQLSIRAAFSRTMVIGATLEGLP